MSATPAEKADVPSSAPARVELDETITDPAVIRACDEPDERGDFPCCTTPAPVGAGLDLDAIEAMVRRGALYDCDALTLTLVAEVRRLAALCIPLTDLAQELDMARQNLHHSRAMSSAHFERAERENARAEAAEAEVGTLRAKVAEAEAVHVRCGEGVCNAGPKPEICHECGVAWPCPTFAALAVTTGEGQ